MYVTCNDEERKQFFLLVSREKWLRSSFKNSICLSEIKWLPLLVTRDWWSHLSLNFHRTSSATHINSMCPSPSLSLKCVSRNVMSRKFLFIISFLHSIPFWYIKMKIHLLDIKLLSQVLTLCNSLERDYCKKKLLFFALVCSHSFTFWRDGYEEKFIWIMCRNYFIDFGLNWFFVYLQWRARLNNRQIGCLCVCMYTREITGNQFTIL